jgi:hypothetical protein
MTAIYAYAYDDIAFVAGDTRRLDPQGVPRVVSKLHHWSDGVVLAQAGEAQFLSDLLRKILPLAGFFPETAEGFVDAFSQLNARFWSKAEDFYEKKAAGSVPEGTVLVAASATKITPARVFKLDFETGAITNSANREDADGTDIPQFRADASRHLKTLRANEPDAGIPLDIWAVRCVEDASKNYSRYIGPPVDALIARPCAAKDRILVRRRMTKPDQPAIDLFRVP